MAHEPDMPFVATGDLHRDTGDVYTVGAASWPRRLTHSPWVSATRA
jgi:hypothetical protein